MASGYVESSVDRSHLTAHSVPPQEFAVNAFLARIAAWLSAGYPEGVPGPDRVPLLALLTRRLTNDEIRAIAEDLEKRPHFDHIDIGVLITQMTDEMPREEDIERVRRHLALQGWPLDDPRDGKERGPEGTDGEPGGPR